MEVDGQQEERSDQVGQSKSHTHTQLSTQLDNTGGPSLLNSSPTEHKDLNCVLDNSHRDVEGNVDNVPVTDTHSKEQRKGADPNATNGTNEQRARGEVEEDIEVASEISFSREANLTSSPSQNFKSSYAKSLADSYRRASIPLVLSSPKGQFILKGDDIISLKSSQVKPSDFNKNKFLSLNVNGNKTTSPQSIELPLSLPPTFDSGVRPEKRYKSGERPGLASPFADVYDKLLGGDVFVAFDQLSSMCESSGSSFSLQDWHSLGSIITSDGRKLVNLSDLKAKWKQDEVGSSENGHSTVNGSDKITQCQVSQQSDVEGSVVEGMEAGGRVERLCEILGNRDATIQRLEEDLLRIRMECQRLMVDNRSLKSSVGHSTSLSLPVDSRSEAARLQQQVELLTAQLNKAERSRHTYEAATRQLVDFLHTVNSTLHCSTPSTSPSASIHSSTAPQDEDRVDDSPYRTMQHKQSRMPDDTTPYRTAHPHHTRTSHDDSPYRSIQQHHYPLSPPPALDLAHSADPTPVRRNSDSLRKSGSVWALPTHSTQTRRVIRAASTHCVASAVSLAPSPTSKPPAPTTSDKSRSLASEFLATRARDLIASLRSLMRSDSILKLNLEPKKSGSVSSGRSQSSGRSLRSEESPATDSSSNRSVRKEHRRKEHEGSRQSRWFVDDIENSDHSQVPQSSENGDGLQLPASKIGNSTQAPSSENEASLAGVERNFNQMGTTAVPRIGTGPTREDIMQKPSTIEANCNPQPLSLMVLGEAASSSSRNQHFSSLPSHPPRSSRRPSDSEQHLVWV